MIIVNIGETPISKRAKRIIENEIERWRNTSRTFNRYIKTVRRIVIDDENEKEDLLGFYEDKKKEIRIFAKACQYLHIIKYVFFHEFGHHIRSESGKFRQEYSSETKNLPYCIEEKEAEIVANYYLHLFSLHNERLKKIINHQIIRYNKKIVYLKNKETQLIAYFTN
jgi:hypothetical protein